MARLAFESPDQPEVLALIAELDAYQASLYPPESCYLLDLTALMQPQVRFLVARDEAGRVVACGAVVLRDAYAELKRMMVHPRARGQGTGRAVLAALEAAAAEAGCTGMKLETGPLQPEALALYERCGYARCGPFGDYPDDPWSVFMEKTLLPARAASPSSLQAPRADHAC